MSASALGWALAQLLAAGAIVATALSAGVVMAALGERRRPVTVLRAARRGPLSARTLALMERDTD